MAGDNDLRGIREEAATWLARLRADDVSEADHEAFRAWMNADPRHGEVFDRATRLFESVGAVAVAPAGARGERRNRSRRMVVGGLVAVLGGGGLAAVGWRQAGAQTFRTGHGERSVVRLQDGSTLTLDALSAARFEPLQRRLLLREGRASLEIAAGRRPFCINAEGWSAVAEGGLCEVSLLEGGYSLLVVSGQARVSSLMAGPGETLVRAGERFTSAGVEKAQSDHLLAWREGQLAFEDATLAAACRAFNRYSPITLEVDTRVASLPVSGVFAADHGEAFAKGVAQMHGLKLRKTAGVLRLEPAG